MALGALTGYLLAALLLAQGAQCQSLTTFTKQQQNSPLMGQGVPSNITMQKGIFVSAWLNRILDIDDVNYEVEAIFEILISWEDPEAMKHVLNRINTTDVDFYRCGVPDYGMTDDEVQVCREFNQVCSKIQYQALSDDQVTEWLAIDSDLYTKCSRYQAGCNRPCNNNAGSRARCCDDIFLPDFTSPNMQSAPQDGLNTYNIYFDNQTVVWYNRVHARWIVPMYFNKFPFDSHTLNIRWQFNSVVNLSITSSAAAVVDLGVENNANRGDDASDWQVTDFQTNVVPYEYNSTIFRKIGNTSHPLDPAVRLGPDISARTLRTEPMVYNGNKVIVFILSVSRDYKYHVVNSIMPILICGYLGMLPFALPHTELANRIMLVVTVFLSLTAVQFVVSSTMPATHDMLPTQWLVLGTYTSLAIVALESIVVYELDNWIHTGYRLRVYARNRQKEFLAKGKALLSFTSTELSTVQQKLSEDVETGKRALREQDVLAASFQQNMSEEELERTSPKLEQRLHGITNHCNSNPCQGHSPHNGGMHHPAPAPCEAGAGAHRVHVEGLTRHSSMELRPQCMPCITMPRTRIIDLISCCLLAIGYMVGVILVFLFT